MRMATRYYHERSGETYLNRNEVYTLLLEHLGTSKASRDRDDFKRGYAQALENTMNMIWGKEEKLL